MLTKTVPFSNLRTGQWQPMCVMHGLELSRWTERMREKEDTKDDTLVHIEHTWEQYGILFLYLNEEEEEDAIHVPIFKKTACLR